MDARGVVIEMYEATQRCGRPSMRAAFSFARTLGAVFSDVEGRAWIRTHLAQPALFQADELRRSRGGGCGEPAADGAASSFICPRHAMRRDCGAECGEAAARGAAHARAEVSLSSTPSDSNESSGAPVASGAESPDGVKQGTKRRSAPARDVPTPQWAIDLEAQVEPLLKRELRTLEIPERFVVARVHALRFANCTRTEARNKSAATKIAAGLATMARSKNYGDLTVRHYLAYGAKLHEMRERTPWFNPWAIEAVVRFAS